MTYFFKNGNILNVADDKQVDMYEQLPVGNYVIKFNEMTGNFYLEMVDSFTLPSRLYGDVTKYTTRILNTFNERNGTTGVLLTGEKGSGKTLLLKSLSIEAAKSDIPSIIINSEFHGETFNTFIQKIDQPVVIIFDEFEKVYEYENQERLLTLLDGVYSSKKLFIFTSNDRYKISTNMTNRPGRLYYFLEYSGLSKEFIIEYCQENLDDKNEIEKLVLLSTMFNSFNFDMLKSIVEEMNRYDETAQEVAKIVNAKPDSNMHKTYKITLTVDGKVIDQDDLDETTWRGNPYMHNIQIHYTPNNKKGGVKPKKVRSGRLTGFIEFTDGNGFKDVGKDENMECVTFENRHLQTANGADGLFTYKNTEQNAELILTAENHSKFDYLDLLS